MRVVVTGLIGSIPVAGLTLHYLQYLLGLRALGCAVHYLEDVGGWYFDPVADKYYDSEAVAREKVEHYPIEYIAKIMKKFGMEYSWTFVNHAGEAFGVVDARLKEYLSAAELFINVTGAGRMREEYLQIPHRAYVDTDPGYLQLKIAGGNKQELAALRQHTAHFSFGCNIGASDCLIPTLDITWHPTVQPICLDLWPIGLPPQKEAPFTTILKWHTYDAVEFNDEIFGLKDIEFMKFINLPKKTTQAMELATAGQAPVDDLAARGWRLRHAPEISASIERYREYIQGSRGEWSIAKNCYVKTKSGWFGDRSASYLASGRPVVLQSTGFERWLATGLGVLEFSTLEVAQEAISSINANYQMHSRASRELAESSFEATKVLARLVDLSMSS